MIPRYTNPEMGRIWTEQRRYETWLDVELAATDAMAAAGIVPVEAAAELRTKARFDVARIEDIEKVTHHDVIAFTTSVAEHVGPAARWLHFGLTSSDVVDTAQALQLVEACDVILRLVEGLREAVRTRAFEHQHTPMIGRTHGVHAEPMTFGLKLALWYDQLGRDLARLGRARDVIRVGQISGAVGTFAHLDPSIEADVCRRLGLEAQPDRLRADRRPEPAAACQRHGGLRERSALARARYLALVGRTRHPARQLHRARPHAAPVHAHRGRHGGVSRPDARQSRAIARRGVLGASAPRAGAPRHLARAGV